MTLGPQFNNITRPAANIASDLHDAWRAPRRLDDGSYDPRMKDDGKGGQVDIANTSFKDLPPKWQAENMAAAEGVVRAIHANPTGDDDAIADVVHQDWLGRNSEWAEEGQKLPYAQLSQEEQDKDRAVVRIARSFS